MANHVFCSDCWRSSNTNKICTVLFWTYTAATSLTVVLFLYYFILKSKTKSDSRKSFTFIFAFVVCWLLSLCLWFTEAYFDYGFKFEIWITSVPIFFTFLIITVVIYNLLQIYNQLTSERARVTTSMTVFTPVALMCILTQVFNPLLATFEDSNQAEISNDIYEHNWYYFTRNALTTLAFLVLSGYIGNTCHLLCGELSKHKQFDGVKQRVVMLSVLMEIVLVLRLIMIWTQNQFWYMD